MSYRPVRAIRPVRPIRPIHVRLLAGLAALQSLSQGAPVFAQHLFPGPEELQHDAALATLAASYDRQFSTFHAAPYSMSLDVHIPLDDAVSRGAVEDFLADANGGTGPDAFFDHSGLDVFDVVEHYGEIGDLGMFGGMAAGGDAARYAVVRDRCASTAQDCDLVDHARARLLELLDVLHIAHAITGDEGVVVRGLFRRGMPRRGGDPATIPLRDPDGTGNPNPPCSEKPENPTGASFSQRLRFREDATQSVPGDPASGRFPDWLWMDNASKDQLTGWVYAMGLVYDVVRDDPAISESLVARLADDAARMGRRLMRTAGPLGLDLSIIDGDGCATTFHDLHAEELEGIPIATFGALFGPQIEDPDVRAAVVNFRNAFNALLGLAAIRTFCHIAAAPDVCSFYYDELVERRRWHELLVQATIPIDELPPDAQVLLQSLGFPADLGTIGSLGIDANHLTNYSNVNMAFMGFFGLLRYEPEPDLRALYQSALERSLWDTDINARQPVAIAQSFFDLIYAAFRAEGTDDVLVERAGNGLASFPDPPYWNDPIENCDADEIVLGFCTAVDGVTAIEIASSLGRGDALVAVEPVPMEVRPPSNYEWRSNPYAVNGGGGDRLNPGGDFRGTYWLARYLVRGDESANLAPDPVPEPSCAESGLVVVLALSLLARRRPSACSVSSAASWASRDAGSGTLT